MKIRNILVALLTTLTLFGIQFEKSFAMTSLEETLRYAFEYNPNIKAAKESRQEAVYRVKEAKAGYFPTIGIWANAGFEQNDNITTRNNATEDDVVGAYGAGLQFSQPIWKGGETMATVTARTEDLNYKALELMDSANSIAYSAISAHADILRRQKLVAFAMDNVAEHKKILNLLRTRVRQGLSSQGDIDLVRGRLSRAEATLSLYQQGLKLAQVAYHKVTGQRPDADLAKVINPLNIYGTEEEAKEASINKNIRIQADLAAIRSALAETNVSRSSFLPRLNLDGGTNFIDQDYDGNNKDMNWSLGLNMQWNLFNGGADVADLKANSAKVRQLRQNLHATMDEVNEELTSAFTMTKHAEELMELYGVSAKSAKRAKDNYTIQFEVGKKDLLSVLDAEGEYFFSIVESEVNKTDAILGKYRLLAISGALLDEIGISRSALEESAMSTEEDVRWSINQNDFYQVDKPQGTTLTTK